LRIKTVLKTNQNVNSFKCVKKLTVINEIVFNLVTLCQIMSIRCFTEVHRYDIIKLFNQRVGIPGDATYAPCVRRNVAVAIRQLAVSRGRTRLPRGASPTSSSSSPRELRNVEQLFDFCFNLVVSFTGSTKCKLTNRVETDSLD